MTWDNFPIQPINKPLIGPDEIHAVTKVLESGELTSADFYGGHYVCAFEKSMAEYLKCRHVVAVSSGTDAITAMLIAKGVEPQEEIIVPSFTFTATANAVLAVGAIPVFADIDPKTFTLDPESVKKMITINTVGIMPVHLYGHMADLDPLAELAQKKNISLFEDAAQALGSTYQGAHLGTLTEAGCFSLHASKVMTAGEGGFVATNDDTTANSLRQIRNHGLKNGYPEKHGRNMRMSEIHAAIAGVQLKRLPTFLKHRRRNAEQLNQLLMDTGCTLPVSQPHVEPNYSLYTISHPARDELQRELISKGFRAQVYYKYPLHHTYMAIPERLPHSDHASKTVLSLPVHPDMTPDHTLKMADIIVDFDKQH